MADNFKLSQIYSMKLSLITEAGLRPSNELIDQAFALAKRAQTILAKIADTAPARNYIGELDLGKDRTCKLDAANYSYREAAYNNDARPAAEYINNTICLYDNVVGMDDQDLRTTIIHELTHAIDPKINNGHRTAWGKWKSRVANNNTNNYFIDPVEFEAISNTIVGDLISTISGHANDIEMVKDMLRQGNIYGIISYIDASPRRLRQYINAYNHWAKDARLMTMLKKRFWLAIQDASSQGS